MDNGLSKEQQSANGLLTKRKGDWCELMAQAHYRQLGWWIYPKMSGPIDMVIINETTGEVRFIDPKAKGERKNTKTGGTKISRIVTHPLKDKLKIEIVYVDDNGNIEEAYGKGLEEWHKEFKVARNKNGQYNGRVEKK
tara:strand:+ start:59 stop:472 length:414 start_codon:yes stop_codon:yes gene_type:complete